MNKKWYLLISMLLLMALVACGGGDAPATDDGGGAEEPAAEEPAAEEPAAEEEEMEEEEMEEEEAMEESAGSIAVLLPDSASSARWEADDRRFLAAAFDAAGVEYTIVNAEGDASTMQTQAEQAITNGAKVLLMVNLDSGSGAAIIAQAREAGVSVIDYDRLTIEGDGADFYVSFDNESVGRLQGEGLVQCVEEAGLVNPRVAVLNGSPTDNNATLFKNGYDGVINPLFDSGDWTEVDDQSVPDWDNQQALVIFEQMLTAANGEIDAAIAANDGLAGSVAAALANQGLDPIPVTGQDATVGGIQRVLSGEQCMTVYKAIKAEAEAAAALAIALLNGEDTSGLVTGSVNNGTSDVPSVLLIPVSVTKDNVMDTVIADGFRTLDEICVGDYEQYCAALDGGDEEMAEEEMDEEMAADDKLVPAPACDVDLTGETLVLYQQAGREGPLAAILGQGFAYATEDALTMINREGGICGAELTVEFGETNYDVEQEISVYEQFRAADPKPFILYTYGSGATVALKDRVIDDQIVNFAAGLNAEAIYVPRGGYTYGAAPIYSDQFAGYLTWLSENWDTAKPASAGDEIIVGVIGWPNAFGAGATTPEALAIAEDLGITVLPLEEQPLSPDADVSGQVQNMIVSGANVIWNQSLSFSVAQVVGTVHALGFWEDVQVSGVNWSMHNDVPAFLGDNPQLMSGYCGTFPYAYWSDTDVVGVAAAMVMFDEAGRPESDRSTTYLTTFGQFLATRDILIETVNTVGSTDITGEDVLNTMIEMGTISGGDISVYDVDAETRSPRQSQIRCIEWDGSQLNWVVVEDYFELPDTRPSP